MTPFHQHDRTTLYHGDCLSVMPALGVQVDSIITDPPYGLGFMGKQWDTPGSMFERKAETKNTFDHVGGNHNPSNSKDRQRTQLSEGRKFQQWCTGWAEACLQVTKPGGMLLAFGGTRTFHRLACAIEDAGWEIRDCIMWVYGSGFPKSLDISKAIDNSARLSKKNNPKFDEVRAWLRGLVKKAGLTYREIDTALGNPNSHKASHYLDNSQPQIPTANDWEILKSLLGVDTEIDRHRPHETVALFEMEVIGFRKVNRGVAFSSDGPDELPITVPTTDAAKLWKGYGTALKPAWEPIIVAMKPLDGTFAENAQRHGVAGLAIDACRVETGAAGKAGAGSHKAYRLSGTNPRPYHDQPSSRDAFDQSSGRFPANLIHDGSEEVLAGFPDCIVNKPGKNSSSQGYSGGWGSRKPFGYDTAGSAARFFYCAKASRSERGKTNTHPTVKPLALMRYLCRLTKTPTGGIVLDPFAGSGSTLIAASQEGREAIGIEQDEGHCRIIVDRFGVRPPKESSGREIERPLSAPVQQMLFA